ncbi:MAG: sigma-54-dependent Fis family transcriptional regulator [Nitrospirae bacterium]|nr:sigma-54-dependent Fis family transcriptional regulator [Nitrospirota bacterium]
MLKVVVTDDDKNLRKVILSELAEEGYHVAETDSGAGALHLLERDDYDVLLLDLNLPDISGMEVLKKIKQLEIPVEVVVLTGDTTISAAVEAMKRGAYDYITKPFKLNELKTVIEKAFEKKKLLIENLRLKTQIKIQAGHRHIETRSPLMLKVLETAKRVAVSDFPVLITGESGVGKELLSRTIHYESGRADGPFVPINCGAIPENMLESELFGHEKGAFTGAHEKKLGLLEIANNGTLLLDEVGELPLQLQVKLLRVIETKSFYRVGGTKEVRVDVKFLCATNKDLRKEADKGSFRPDLYYRISALTLELPPLRERKEDIPLLADYFIRNSPDFRHKRLSKEAMDLLAEYSWPGNIRELQNVMHRTLLLSRGDVIGREDLPSDLRGGDAVAASHLRLEDIEKDHILKVLREVGYQKGRAAEILGIDPKTLYRKLLGYGIRE